MVVIEHVQRHGGVEQDIAEDKGFCGGFERRKTVLRGIRHYTLQGVCGETCLRYILQP